jgi:hypothetical protein
MKLLWITQAIVPSSALVGMGPILQQLAVACALLVLLGLAMYISNTKNYQL